MLFESPVRIAGFKWETLPKEQETKLNAATQVCSALAVSMVARANSGHPAGSLSSMKMYLSVYGAANLTPQNCATVDRDYVVISHGHTSPGAYATLAYYGFVDPLEAVADFRKTGSMFQGHVERNCPGIDWGSGNLGQGLSAAAGFALASKACGRNNHVYVLMGDGEQPKGQIAEARRTIISQNLSNVTVLIDVNDIQISGRTDQVLPVNIEALWLADGWNVLKCDGNSFSELYDAMKKAKESPIATVILCKTIMGQGVSFMEDIPDYHGKAATGDLYKKAMQELGQPDILELASAKAPNSSCGVTVTVTPPSMNTGAPKTYQCSEKTDNRSGFGTALADVGALNYKEQGRTPILVFDCDLAGSVKTDGFQKKCPDWFIQCGIQEHSTATTAGAASTAGVVSLWADFGVFGLSEAYNQQRLNDINHTNLKLVLTHVGLDVGEDGMTHQAIDYISLLANTFGWKLVVPADPNQTDRATRWALAHPGNVCLAMGRSKTPTICKNDQPLFAEDFKYGEVTTVKEGKDCAILALGAMTAKAMKAAELLEQKGINAAIYAISCPLEVDEVTLKAACSTGAVVTVEDHNVNSGMGVIWTSRMMELGLSCKVSRLGVFKYGYSGPSEEVYRDMGLDAEGIAASVSKLLGK